MVLSRLVESRTAVVLSLFLPMIVGVALYFINFAPFGNLARYYFNVVNIRMLAAPSSAMDVYNEYLPPSSYLFLPDIVSQDDHALPISRPALVVMDHAYNFGAINASLFATEGIASVGRLFAPLAAFVCGLVIAVGNRLSAGLPARFVLISGALLPQVLTNVPLTTTLLTHGMAALFLLWYITPREIFRDREEIEAQA
jgi:hypothetical protein